jgi:hypothetical protein
MKKLLVLALLGLVLGGCKKDDADMLGSPITYWQNFVYVDSEGKNLIPNEDLSDSKLNPVTFKAIEAVSGKEIGSYNYTPVADGYIFRFIVYYADEIVNSPQYLNDSTITVFTQIGPYNDTMVIKPVWGGQCTADFILMNGDTIAHYNPCTRLYIKKGI